MSPNQIVEQVKTKLTQSQQHFGDELKKLRTGRAHPSMLEGVMVKAYGTQMPLVQVASTTAPEAQQLQITPFDPGTLQAIAAAIRENPSLGLNPIDDGRVVRVPIPPLTTERRAQIVKSLKEKMEETFIQMRNARHDGLHVADQAKKDKALTEDDVKSVTKQIDDLMSKVKAEVESQAKAKEQEIMTV